MNVSSERGQSSGLPAGGPEQASPASQEDPAGKPASRFPRADYRSLSPYDPGRTPVEVDLSDNTNLWGPNPAALAVIRGAAEATVSRYPSVYAEPLKEAVANTLGVSPENVTTGCGSDGILDAAFRAALFPPGTLTYPGPSFSMVEAFGTMNGLESRMVDWDRAEEDPALLLDGDPALVYLCRPNNPTGATLSREWMEEFLEMAGPEGPVIVVDEAYADFAEDDVLQEALAHPRLLILRTLSKLYGLAGLRVGFGVGTPPVIREMEKSRGPYKVAHISERAAAAALGDPSDWAKDVISRTAENRARLFRSLTDRGFAPLPSQGNFLLVPVGAGSAVSINQGLRARGVTSRPFPDLPGTGDALRVSIGPWNLMERFLEALDAVLEESGPNEGEVGS